MSGAKFKLGRQRTPQQTLWGKQTDSEQQWLWQTLKICSLEIMQVPKQGAFVAVRAMLETDPTAELHIRRSIPQEKHRWRQPRSMLSQPAFDWKTPDRYVELLHFEMKKANVLQTKAFNLNNKEKVPAIKNWLGREGLQFIQTLTNAEIEACKSITGLFNIKINLKLQHNEMIWSLQYCKLHRKENGSAQGWIGRFQIKAVECHNKEHYRQFKEQFINGISNKIMHEIIKEVVMWAQRGEAYRARKWWIN